MAGKTKLNFWLDLAIFTAFLLTALTGFMLWLLVPGGRGSGQLVYLGLSRHGWVDLHRWLGLVMLLGALLHLILHRQWIACVGPRFFKKLVRPVRLNFWLDSMMLIAFSLTGLSGMGDWLVLPGGGYRGGRNPFYGAPLIGLTRHGWQDLHLWAGLAMIVILAVHLALHWRWVICVARRYAEAASLFLLFSHRS